MDEIREVESELRRLREDAVRYKTEADKLKKEKRTIEARNEYLVNKLKEASYVYGEAGKRLLYFINNQVNPVTKRLNDIESREKKLRLFDQSLADTLAEMEKTVKQDLSKVDKRIASLSADFRADSEKLRRALKASVRKSQEGDMKLEERLLALQADFDNIIKKSNASQEKKFALKLSAGQKKLDSKIELLKERSIILGKDIEALRKFEGDIQGLEGKLQTTVSNLTQTRIEMERLSQSLKNQMASTKADVAAGMETLSGDVEKRILEISSELREADEKNLGGLKLELEKSRESAERELESMRKEIAAFEKRAEARVKKDEAALSREMKSFSAGIDKRIAAIEAGIASNSETTKEMERIFNEKTEKLMKRDNSIDEKMHVTEARLAEQIDTLRDMTIRRETAMKNELAKTRKSLERGIEKSSMEADKKIGLMERDIKNILGVSANLEQVAAETEKRKQEIAALDAKIDAINAAVQSKSEKDDMKLRNAMEAMEKDIQGRLEKAESSILSENVRSFNDVRKNLKNDIHTLREENAVLKTEIKNLQKLGAVVTDLQQEIAGMKARMASSMNEMDKLSAKVRSNIEKEALKVSKDMAGISTGLKSELKDVIAAERERFAAKEAELDAKLSELSGTVSEISSASSSTSVKSESNARKLSMLEKKLTRLMNEIVGLKKEYKTEMGKLLKDLEE